MPRVLPRNIRWRLKVWWAKYGFIAFVAASALLGFGIAAGIVYLVDIIV